MKQPRKVNGLLAILLIIGLITSLFFFNKIKTKPNAQAVENTTTPPLISSSPAGLPSFAVVTSTALPSDFPTHVALTLTAMPTIPPTATSTLQPPQCTFPLAQITGAESTPEEYIFSEPQIVLTEPDNLYDIVEWLPNNQEVLVTQDLYSTRVKILQQSIELYNPQTGETQVYATRNATDQPPSWQPELKTVVYPVMNVTGIDTVNHRFEFTRQVWISYGKPDTAQMLADHLSQFSVVVQPGGNQIAYLIENQISKLNASLKKLPSVTLDTTQWDYRQAEGAFPISYSMTWQPGTSLIFIYSNGDTDGGYTFILDSNTGQICELNFDGWALKAHWSSDGRYLAVGRTQGSFPIDFNDLAFLDTITGELYTIVVTPQEMIGNYYVDDFAWAPDNHHLLALGSVYSFQNANQVDSDHHGLYLVDFISGQSNNILPEYSFSASSSQNNLTWSPDGSKLLVRCPTHEDERICLINVQRTGE